MTTLEWEHDAFAVWLEAHRSEPVGYLNTISSCPLARWRQSLGEKVAVDRNQVLLLCADLRVAGAPPAWASAFVVVLDGLVQRAYPYERPVTGRAALRILRRAIRLSALGNPPLPGR